MTILNGFTRISDLLNPKIIFFSNILRFFGVLTAKPHRYTLVKLQMLATLGLQVAKLRWDVAGELRPPVILTPT